MLIYSWIFVNYNAHSTAIYCLWSWLPFVILLDKSYCIRVIASLLSALNLQDLITKDFNHYEEIVINLSRDINTLNSIKYQLIKSIDKNSLFNSLQTKKDLKKPYLLFHYSL